MKKIRILIAEDHKLIRETWIFLLNSDPRFEVIAACEDSSEAICLANIENPDIVLMDINIGPLNGFLATSRMQMVAPASRVIALSFHNESYIVHKMFEAGARGYVTKNSGREEIEEAIMRVYAGELYVCSEIMEAGFQFSNNTQPENKLELLTKTEVIVSQLIKDGLRSRDISSKLDISVRTVEAHRANIYKKLKLNSTVALVKLLTDSENKLAYS